MSFLLTEVHYRPLANFINHFDLFIDHFTILSTALNFYRPLAIFINRFDLFIDRFPFLSTALNFYRPL
jgi:hypothetical protein